MTSRRAHPAVTFFGTLILRSFCLCRQSIQFLVYRFLVHFFFIGSLSVFFQFRFQFHFRFSFVSFAVSFLRVFFVESWCQPYRRSSSFVPSFAYDPFFVRTRQDHAVMPSSKEPYRKPKSRTSRTQASGIR
jgi:hypothetical protein